MTNLNELARSLAYAIEAAAGYENRMANEAYAVALNPRLYGMQCQDEAWEECKRTAVLADLATDLVYDVEDEIFYRENAR